VKYRTRGHACPFCSGRRCTPDTSFGALYPALAAQWHPENNGTLTPHDVTPHAQRLVWWKCPRGPDHEWREKVGKRTDPRSSGCPFCTSHRVCIDNCLATRFPAVAREWHPTLNAPWTSWDVMGRARRSVWWKCELGHVWKARIFCRTSPKPSGCPVCARRRWREAVTARWARKALRLGKYEGVRAGPVRHVK
jgi:hypothetical protein